MNAMLPLLAMMTSETQPPAAVAALLVAIRTGDLEAARRALAPDAVIMRGIDTTAVEASVQTLADHLRGCRRSRWQWEADATDRSRTVVTVNWDCPSRRGVAAFIWTSGSHVVHIQFE